MMLLTCVCLQINIQIACVENLFQYILQTRDFYQCIPGECDSDFSLQKNICRIIHKYEGFHSYVIENAYLGHLSIKILWEEHDTNEPFHTYVSADEH